MYLEDVLNEVKGSKKSTAAELKKLTDAIFNLPEEDEPTEDHIKTLLTFLEQVARDNREDAPQQEAIALLATSQNQHFFSKQQVSKVQTLLGRVVSSASPAPKVDSSEIEKLRAEVAQLRELGKAVSTLVSFRMPRGAAEEAAPAKKERAAKEPAAQAAGPSVTLSAVRKAGKQILPRRVTELAKTYEEERPPKVIFLVSRAAMKLLENQNKEYRWQEAQESMAEGDFAVRVREFDYSSVSPAVLKGVEKLMKQSGFDDVEKGVVNGIREWVQLTVAYCGGDEQGAGEKSKDQGKGGGKGKAEEKKDGGSGKKGGKGRDEPAKDSGDQPKGEGRRRRRDRK
mmetsp:Transcript_59397/g.137222  ORF Transcript_59397/g.137222 Transcript_59397/m.137222 type:complete len:341 (+) Transcript_59397:98-1120(+)